MSGEVLTLTGALVARAQSGDPEALERVYRTYESRVYGLACRICASEADAEDVVQETFLEVLRSIPKFRGNGSLWGWIRKITVSKALMHLRRQRRRKEHALLEERVRSVKPADPTEPLDLEAALGRLSPVARAVLWLHDGEGYTHREIGEMMGKTASFSKSQLSRAHKRLRELLLR